ncbi:hypothetical protein N7456_000715 [Penicillium angulare]|uniref:Uncharacterized protein n=1 Tax=Penicillium angulare TaxID=116970 RepID=A0A9W9GCP6_9EURO|nr:hypothetical protein N7456_000715 [Penicillium angulare]
MDMQDEEERLQDYNDQQLDNLSRGLRGLHYSWGGILLPASSSCSYQTQHEYRSDYSSDSESCKDDTMQDCQPRQGDSIISDDSDLLQHLTQNRCGYHSNNNGPNYTGYTSAGKAMGLDHEDIPNLNETPYLMNLVEMPQESHDSLIEPVFCQGGSQEQTNEYGLTRLQMARLDQIVLFNKLHNDP